MFKTRSLQTVALLVSAWVVTGCSNPREGTDSSMPEIDDVKVAEVSMDESSAPVYNIFVENSGSMQGFFNGNTTLKTIIKEFYDRIDGSMNGDITLNYINTKIVKDESDITRYLGDLQRRCNERNTKIDDILKMAMDSLSGNEVNLVFSDYCFDSPAGNFATARSGITNIFEKKLRQNHDLCVAIMKFDCTFDGYYYPGQGSIRTKQNLPAYVWAFGSNSLIKKIVNLPLSVNREVLVLEPSKSYSPEYVKLPTQRMIDKKDGKIIVKKWKADRHESDLYKLSFKADLSNSCVDSNYILGLDNYSLSEGYRLSDIVKDDNKGVYTFTVETNHPSPNDVVIRLNNSLPSWVSQSNYDGNALPPLGTTLGISSLIEGVYNAYIQQSDNIFNIKLSIK